VGVGGRGSMMGMIMAMEVEIVVGKAVAKGRRESLVRMLTSANRSTRARKTDERWVDVSSKQRYASTHEQLPSMPRKG